MYLSGEAPSRTRQARVRSITVLAVRCYSGLVRLLGRVAELAACRGALSDADAGAAAAVITGAPGIGKTSVWRAAAGSWPAGVVVLRTTGVPGGQAAFANLADLLDPVAWRVLPGLPAPQAVAMRAALGHWGRRC